MGSSRLNREATILGDALVAEGDPRAIAQAIFEVGALLCLPRVARCHPCPLRSGCASARSDDPCALPRPRARKPPTRWGGTVAVPVLPDGRVVLRRRSDDAGLLAGMWFPLAEVGAGLDPPDPVPIAARLAGTPPSRCEVRGRGRWRFTHVLLEPMVVRVQVDHAPDAPDLAARTPVAWADHALPSATRALLATAGISLAPARPHRENAAP